jgi:hypothetical protein
MKFVWKSVIIIAVLIYIALITYFFVLREREDDISHCPGGVCLRFCCKKKNCHGDYEKIDFNFNSFPGGMSERFGVATVQVISGDPNCILKRLSEDEPWKVRYVSIRHLDKASSTLKFSIATEWQRRLQRYNLP